MQWKAVQIGSGTWRGPRLVRDEARTDGIVCRFCKGKGKDRAPWSGLCPVCGGRGHIDMSGPNIGECAFCRGTGHAEPRTTNLCSVCNGRGLVYLPESFETCSCCKGRGRGTGIKIPCRECAGKGIIEKTA